MSALSDWLQRIMFATINLGSLVCCKLLQIVIEVTLELYLSRFFHKGKNVEELTTNTEVSKVSLKIIIISGT